MSSTAPKPVATGKKRGRKPKAVKDAANSEGTPLSSPQKAQGSASEDDGTPKKKQKKPLDSRFGGMTEEQIMEMFLPDHLKPGLEIVFIGINPGLLSAHLGHHYCNANNHFWPCMYESGLIPRKMGYKEDAECLDYGIGFTNIVPRTTRSSNDLTRKEIKEWSAVMCERMKELKPLVACFNGKGIYEIFQGGKCEVGVQDKPLPGTDTVVYVMPSTSGRAASHPRRVDKLKFFYELKELRDKMKLKQGKLETMDAAYHDSTEKDSNSNTGPTSSIATSSTTATPSDTTATPTTQTTPSSIPVTSTSTSSHVPVPRTDSHAPVTTTGGVPMAIPSLVPVPIPSSSVVWTGSHVAATSTSSVPIPVPVPIPSTSVVGTGSHVPATSTSSVPVPIPVPGYNMHVPVIRTSSSPAVSISLAPAVSSLPQSLTSQSAFMPSPYFSVLPQGQFLPPGSFMPISLPPAAAAQYHASYPAGLMPIILPGQQPPSTATPPSTTRSS